MEIIHCNVQFLLVHIIANTDNVFWNFVFELNHGIYSFQQKSPPSLHFIFCKRWASSKLGFGPLPARGRSP